MESAVFSADNEVGPPERDVGQFGGSRRFLSVRIWKSLLQLASRPNLIAAPPQDLISSGERPKDFE